MLVRTGRDVPTEKEESTSLVKIRGWVSSPSIRDGGEEDGKSKGKKGRKAAKDRASNLATCQVAEICYRSAHNKKKLGLFFFFGEIEMCHFIILRTFSDAVSPCTRPSAWSPWPGSTTIRSASAAGSARPS